MTEKLQAAENRYEELTQKLTDPDVLGNPELYKKIATEHSELEELVRVYRTYKEAARDRDEARDLLEKPLEDEFRELVKEEYREKAERTTALEDPVLSIDGRDKRPGLSYRRTAAAFLSSF